MFQRYAMCRLRNVQGSADTRTPWSLDPNISGDYMEYVRGTFRQEDSNPYYTGDKISGSRPVTLSRRTSRCIP